MVRVGQNKKDILKDRDEELLEERIGCCRVSLCDIGNELETHIETSIFNFPIVVLACPHARIDDKLELSVIELE